MASRGQRPMTGNDWGFVAGAAFLVVFAGVLAAADSGFSGLARSRGEALVRDGRRGADRLQRVLAAPPHYLNVLLLLRVAAELTATVFIAVVVLDRLGVRWQAVLVTAAVMTVVSYVLVGVAPRTLGRQHPASVGCRTAGLTPPPTPVPWPFPPPPHRV